jgi:hypothetical protein
MVIVDSIYSEVNLFIDWYVDNFNYPSLVKINHLV